MDTCRGRLRKIEESTKIDKLSNKYSSGRSTEWRESNKKACAKLRRMWREEMMGQDKKSVQ